MPPHDEKAALSRTPAGGGKKDTIEKGEVTMAKNRGANEGSIYKRKDGRWAGVVNLGWRNGKRFRKSVYGRTRADVQDKLNEALRNHRLGIPFAPERLTVEQFLNGWLENHVKPGTRPRTYESYEGAVRLHIAPAIGKIRLGKLTAENIQAMVNDKSHSGLAPRTVEYIHSVLSRALNRAVKWDLVRRNVAKLATTPRVPRKLLSPLTPDEARVFLKHIRGDRNEALFTVAMALGLRKGEALGLRWEDVDIEKGTLTVRYALQRRKGQGKVLVEPKSERSRRTIHMPDVVVKALRAHRARQSKERLAAGSAWKDTGHLFTTTIGSPMDERRVLNDFKKALRAAKLPERRFHDARHTAASLLLAQGVSPRTIMEVLGHSQITLTLNTYAHVMPAMLEDAAGKMDAILGAIE